MRVLGIDGCKAGWIAVLLEDGHFVQAQPARTFDELRSRFPAARVLAVDIPIGLPDASARAADLEARTFLRHRSSTLYVMPPRAALFEETYERAVERCRVLGVPALSRQAYGLRAKILEVESAALQDPRIHEAHPEVSFRVMADALGCAAPGAPKKTWTGLMTRLSLLEAVDVWLPRGIGAAGLAAADDVVDAAAAAWTAHRIALQQARTFPADPPTDSQGRPVAIWC
jgi:predicted RNase H-like nuclease